MIRRYFLPAFLLAISLTLSACSGGSSATANGNEDYEEALKKQDLAFNVSTALANTSMVRAKSWFINNNFSVESSTDELIRAEHYVDEISLSVSVIPGDAGNQRKIVIAGTPREGSAHGESLLDRRERELAHYVQTGRDEAWYKSQGAGR